MSNISSASNNSIVLLNDTTIYINRYFTIIILLFGFIGNILNILVLSQKNFRSNSCGWLFLISSIFNLISIIFGLPTRILSSWNNDPTDTIDWLCKFRSFIVFSSRTSGFWFIMLATIDRWLSSCSNVHFRHLSTLKNAQRFSFIIIFISCLIYIQMFYCYKANLTDTPLKCYGQTILCRYFNDAIYTSITILLPLILMLIFGLLTILNIRQTRHRVQIINNKLNLIGRINENQLKRKIDHHLLKMLLVQIILLSLLTFPQVIQKLYTTITYKPDKSEYDINLDFFLYNLVLLLSFIASGIPFYIYTLCGGELFRKGLFNIFKF